MKAANATKNRVSSTLVSTPQRDDFDEWAKWFKCLADPTRLRILHFVSSSGEPVTVGEIVGAVDMSQSTVSRHLQILGEQRFVFAEADGVRTLIRANETCMTELPRAAEAVMGR
jgi:ArsR family transcriptional regulator